MSAKNFPLFFSGIEALSAFIVLFRMAEKRASVIPVKLRLNCSAAARCEGVKFGGITLSFYMGNA